MTHLMDYEILEKKVIIKIRDKICDNSEELLSSDLFKNILKRCIKDLKNKNSFLLGVFESKDIGIKEIETLIKTFLVLYKMPGDTIPKIIPESKTFFQDINLFHSFVEYLYNFWRDYVRIIVCNSEGDRFDKRPYRTFNATIGQLTSVVRQTYRDIIENLTNLHPRTYRQVIAGAEIASIALPYDVNLDSMYDELKAVPIIRQVLLHPPLILDPPMNKRSKGFKKVDRNPMDFIDINPDEWLCYPAKVGKLLIYIYFHKNFYELGLSLCNLFQIAEDPDLKRKPDGVYLFGVDFDLGTKFESPAVFYPDKENGMLIAAIPNAKEFGYFGYLKKMVLTLYNVTMMESGKMPYHGALVKVILRNQKQATLLIIGDSGAGKSETLNAFGNIGSELIQDMIVIADDMGSLELNDDNSITGYGTEIGAFLRLDDLSPGYAFGQIDRAIIMSPNKVNARIILPVTTYDNVISGFEVDYILYANNYEEPSDDKPILEKFSTAEQAIAVFEEGKVASKGTTNTTGIVQSYYANIFGPPDYREFHDELAHKFFKAAFKKGVFVGQMRTRLGVPGFETKGPDEAARVLLKTIAGE